MNDLLSLTGAAIVFLSLCFGISGCKYVTAKAKAIEIQNAIMSREVKP